MTRIVIMAGGTGGHVFPGLALAQHLKTLDWDIQWLGTQHKMEAEIVPKYDIPIHFIEISGIRRKGLKSIIKAPWQLIKAFFQARRLLKTLKPTVVVGMGGYASGPGGLAAYSLRIPLVIHEQNAVFGLTNKYLAKISKRVLTGFKIEGDGYNIPSSKIVYVGNPIRKAFFDIPSISINNKKTNILVVGGSLGALAINQIVPEIFIELAKEHEISVLHQTGKNKLDTVKKDYGDAPFVQANEFIDDIENAYAQADIIICRAGALTVAEVASAGRLAIFVPLPSAVDDHQTLNAKSLSEQGAAILMPQSSLQEKLMGQLVSLCQDRKKIFEMAQKARTLALPEASSKMVEVILEIQK